MSLNRVVLIGRLVRDPELRTTNTGKNVANFTIAVDKRIKPQDPDAPTADFFRVTAWNQSADFISNYGGKGRLVAVDGRLESRKYVDKEGNNRESVEIVADNLNLLDKRSDNDDDAESTRGNTREKDGDNPAASGGYAQSSRSNGGAGKPAASRPSPALQADEYDPFSDE